MSPFVRVCLAQVERHSLYSHLTAADNVLQLCTPSLLNICCWLFHVIKVIFMDALLRTLCRPVFPRLSVPPCRKSGRFQLVIAFVLCTRPGRAFFFL
jgi:hypothetical protein